jgi:hypothetical protein
MLVQLLCRDVVKFLVSFLCHRFVFPVENLGVPSFEAEVHEEVVNYYFLYLALDAVGLEDVALSVFEPPNFKDVLFTNRQHPLSFNNLPYVLNCLSVN